MLSTEAQPKDKRTMRKQDVDYSLYLVTDSTSAILGTKDICQVVEAALKGGVTCVQYRDKKSETGALIETARKLHAITKKYHVPLLINDRVDVALAVECEGVHIGQDDMSQSSSFLMGSCLFFSPSPLPETQRSYDGHKRDPGYNSSRHK